VHVRRENSEENEEHEEKSTNRTARTEENEPSALGYIYIVTDLGEEEGEDQEEDQEEKGEGVGTNSKSGRRSTKSPDDKDAQKTWETNGTGMKLIGQQIKK